MAIESREDISENLADAFGPEGQPEPQTAFDIERRRIAFALLHGHGVWEVIKLLDDLKKLYNYTPFVAKLVKDDLYPIRGQVSFLLDQRGKLPKPYWTDLD